MPILGVCLGHQAIGQVYGGEVVRAPDAMHGKLASPSHRQERVPRPHQGLPGHPLSLPDRRSREPARGAGDHRRHRGRRDHGRDAQDAIPCMACSSIPKASPRRTATRCWRTSSICQRERRARTSGLESSRCPLTRAGRDRDPRRPSRRARHGRDGRSLRRRSSRAFELIMSGPATPAQIGGFLTALRVRGETVDEIAGAVRAMRAGAARVDAPDGRHRCVRHRRRRPGHASTSRPRAPSSWRRRRAGRQARQPRRISSQVGVADVLEALGVKIDLDPTTISRCIAETGIGFLFAPAHHPAMRHVGHGAQRARHAHHLQPARAARQSCRRQVSAHRRVRQGMGRAHAAGAGAARHRAAPGWCMAATGWTNSPPPASAISPWWMGRSRRSEITPEDAGLADARLADLNGGERGRQCRRVPRLLGGEKGPYRDIVLLNAGAALMVAGKAKTLREGVALAAQRRSTAARRSPFSKRWCR